MGVTRVSGNGTNPTQTVGVPLGTPVENTPKVNEVKDLTSFPEEPEVVEELPDPKPVEEVKEESKPKKKNR